MKTYISLVVVLTLALLSWWFQDSLQDEPVSTKKENAHFPDYFMENFIINSMNDQGKLAYTVKAQRMEHFSDNSSMDLLEPRIAFETSTGNWHVSAEKAQFLSNTQQLLLHKNVHLQRLATSNKSALTIETDFLEISTEKQTAENNDPTHLKIQNIELDAQGILFDNKLGILKLKSKVRGKYELFK